MRFWVASLDYSGDVSISAELMDEMGGHVKKLRNTMRFILGNLNQYNHKGKKPSSHPHLHLHPYLWFSSAPGLSYDCLLDVDKYMLHKLQQFIGEATHHYDNNAFSKGMKTPMMY